MLEGAESRCGSDGDAMNETKQTHTPGVLTMQEAAREMGVSLPYTEYELGVFAVQCMTHGIAVNVQNEPFWREAIHKRLASRGQVRRHKKLLAELEAHAAIAKAERREP